MSAAQALAQFQATQGWEQRARLLMQWGERLPALPAELRNDAHRVSGCESGVWLAAQYVDGGWQFQAASDARLLRGLLALLLLRAEGLDGPGLRKLDVQQWFAELGLERQLSPSRSNGLHAVLQRMAVLVS